MKVMKSGYCLKYRICLNKYNSRGPLGFAPAVNADPAIKRDRAIMNSIPFDHLQGE